MTAIGKALDLHWLTNPSDDDYRVVAALSTAFMQEAIPGEHPTTVEEVKRDHEHVPDSRQQWTVLALERGRAIGIAQVSVDEHRPQAAFLRAPFVVPDRRGCGVGTRLLEAVQAKARSSGRERLRTMTVVGNAASERFARRHGGSPGLVNEHNRCLTSDLDVAQLESWVERAKERARGYSLVTFDGVCPDEHLDAFTAVIPVMNTAPRTDTTEVHEPSAEEVRTNMTASVDMGNESWTACARDDSTGAFVGYTELSLPALRPWLARQGDTGVHPNHREKGLGRWLKAHIALRLLAERQGVEYIDTFNANVNAPMLSINRAMGFRPVVQWQDWDLPV